MSFAQGKEMVCDNCGGKGHVSPDCKKPRDPDAIKRNRNKRLRITENNTYNMNTSSPNTEQGNSQNNDNNQNENQDSNENQEENTGSGVCGIQTVTKLINNDSQFFQNMMMCQPIITKINMANKNKNNTMQTVTVYLDANKYNDVNQNNGINLRDCLLADNESTCDIFCNKNYINNIRESEYEMIINTNGGELKCNLIADFPSYPNPVWYHPQAITNIISFAHLADTYKIEYDNSKEDAFLL